MNATRKVTRVAVLFDDGNEVVYAGEGWYTVRDNMDSRPLEGKDKERWSEHEVRWRTDTRAVRP